MDRRHLVEPVSHWGPGRPRLKNNGAVKLAFKLNRKPWVCDVCGNAIEVRELAMFNPKLGKPSCCCGIKGCQGQSWSRRRIFSLSRGDWLDAEVPIEWLAEMLDTIRQCDHVIWILCTKSPENWRARILAVQNFAASAGNWQLSTWCAVWLHGTYPKHITLLVSVENQPMANERIPVLLSIPAVFRGLSCEPLLEPIDLGLVENGAESPEEKSWAKPTARGCQLDWLIIGGESGPGARVCNVEWVRSLVNQGKAAGVATFVKQMDANYIHSDGLPYSYTHPKGGDPSEWPRTLNVQEFPKGF